MGACATHKKTLQLKVGDSATISSTPPKIKKVYQVEIQKTFGFVEFIKTTKTITYDENHSK